MCADASGSDDRSVCVPHFRASRDLRVGDGGGHVSGVLVSVYVHRCPWGVGICVSPEVCRSDLVGVCMCVWGGACV